MSLKMEDNILLHKYYSLALYNQPSMLNKYFLPNQHCKVYIEYLKNIEDNLHWYLYLMLDYFKSMFIML